MERENILPVLYDLAVTIGSEISVKPLLTRTLQRLFYHTSFSAGFICLDVPACDKNEGQVEVQLDAVVGDFDLTRVIGKPLFLPCELICREAGRETEQAILRCSILNGCHWTRSRSTIPSCATSSATRTMQPLRKPSLP
jgi:diguanylate cyclase